jgi:predicted XRE-type DNA-binding protein
VPWGITTTGTFDAWFDELSDALQMRVLVAVGLVREVGPGLGRPHVDTVNGSEYPNMKELRVQASGAPIRIFFAFDPERAAVMLLGGDKTGDGRFYQRMLRRADALCTTSRDAGERLMPRTWDELRAVSKLTQQQHDEVDAEVRAEIVRMRLSELRKARRRSQQTIAATLGIQQSEVSRIERRSDLYLRTLRSYVEAAGGHLRLIAEFPDAEPIEIDGMGDIEPRASNASA